MEVEQMTCPACDGKGYRVVTVWCDPCAGHGTVDSTDEYPSDTDHNNQEMMTA